ncbi:MAG: hypothetical protein WA117_13050 [Verrucomicrobiia bacterium]
MKTFANHLAVTWVVLVLTSLNSQAQSIQPKPPLEPWDLVSAYRERQIEGWRVLVNQKLDCDEQKKLCDETLKLLGDHLYRVSRVVPAGALAKLRRVPIWVERAHPQHKCMCYHPSPVWLREHGMNPEKAGAVELANAATFLKWTHEQPWMVLHELAHAYHHKVLGHDHKEIKKCFQRAVASKRYESVLYFNGQRKRHYALNNDREYFAEATEAFFGANDFYPFVRAELKEHDPEMFSLLEKLWDVRQ